MNTYLIYGNDYGLIKREIDKITKDVSDVVKFDLSVCKVDELLDDASCISMFGDKKVLIGENALFLTGAPNNLEHNIDYLSNYLEDDRHDNIVILSLISEKLDERKKVVKLLKQKATVIYKEAIEEKKLENFVIDEFKSRGFKIDFKTASYFVEFVGKNVDILLSEIDKMIVYKEDKIILIDDINAISCRAFKDNIFDLTNAIMQKDYKKMYECYNDLMTLGEEPIRIIALLGNQFSLIYQVKLLASSGNSQKEIASILKVHPYRVMLGLQTNYKIKDLENIIKRLHQLDYDIKRGAIYKNVGLDDFLLHI